MTRKGHERSSYENIPCFDDLLMCSWGPILVDLTLSFQKTDF